MKMLLVAATRGEIEPLIRSFSNGDDFRFQIGDTDVRVLITGAGMTATAFALGQHLQKNNFDLALNAGIAGSFHQSTPLGSVYSIVRDTFSELGAENAEEFIGLDHLGLGKIQFMASGLNILNKIIALPEANAITVNTVHGHTGSISRIRQRFNPDIESMEGAAFFYACEQMGIPAVQIRSVSNIVEQRDREKWNIPIAIKNLNNTLINIIKP